MKKLLVFLLLCLPFAAANAQLNAVGVVGNDGYSVLRGSYNMGVPFVPGLSIVPQAAMYSRDGINTALGLTGKHLFWIFLKSVQMVLIHQRETAIPITLLGLMPLWIYRT